MKFLVDTYKKTGTIHHAYLIEGQAEDVLPQLVTFFEKEMDTKTQGNPDFSINTFDTFTIDDGRSLQERQSLRALGNRKVYILNVRFMTTEAQNSLLKVFEEPTEGTHFFIITPTSQILLPTLRSRLQIISHINTDKKSSLSKAKDFISATPAERINLVKEIIEEKDKGKAIDFVSDLEKIFSQQKISSKEVQRIQEILLVKKHLHDRSPSIKLLLEHLALVL